MKSREQVLCSKERNLSIQRRESSVTYPSRDLLDSWDSLLSLCFCCCCCLLVVVDVYSVPIPFKSDRINLKMDERWAKVVAQTNEQRVIWADHVQKLNRKDAKVCTYVCVCVK